MNDINLLLSQNKAFRFVKVEFSTNSTRLYTYKTIDDIEVGDTVIVDTPSEGFKAVKVVKVSLPHEEVTERDFQYKWIVQKVDTSRYEEIVAKEQEAQLLINTASTKVLVKKLNEELAEQIGAPALKQLHKLVRL